MIFYAGWREALQELPDTVRLQVYEAAMDYAMTGEAPELSGMAALAFTFIRQDIDKDRGKFDEMCERNRENVRKRWNKEEEPDESDASDYTSRKSRINENTTVSSRINENTTRYDPIRPDTAVSSRIKTPLDNEYEYEYEYENECENENINNSCFSSCFEKEKEKENFLDFFFWKNFSDPAAEVERFMSWNELHGWRTQDGKPLDTPDKRMAAAGMWKPQSDARRYDAGFLKAWRAVYEMIRPEHPDVARSMADVEVSVKLRQDSLLVAIPPDVYDLMNTNRQYCEPLTAYAKGLKIIYRKTRSSG